MRATALLLACCFFLVSCSVTKFAWMCMRSLKKRFRIFSFTQPCLLQFVKDMPLCSNWETRCSTVVDRNSDAINTSSAWVISLKSGSDGCLKPPYDFITVKLLAGKMGVLTVSSCSHCTCRLSMLEVFVSHPACEIIQWLFLIFWSNTNCILDGDTILYDGAWFVIRCALDEVNQVW